MESHELSSATDAPAPSANAPFSKTDNVQAIRHRIQRLTQLAGHPAKMSQSETIRRPREHNDLGPTLERRQMHTQVDDQLLQHQHQHQHQRNVTQQLRQTFQDVVDNVDDDQLVTELRKKWDAQQKQLEQWEGAADTPDAMLQHLLQRYPDAMALYRQQLIDKELKACRTAFQSERQALLQEHRSQFEALKLKYRTGLEKIVDRWVNHEATEQERWMHRIRQETEARLAERERYWKKRIAALQRRDVKNQ